MREDSLCVRVRVLFTVRKAIVGVLSSARRNTIVMALLYSARCRTRNYTKYQDQGSIIRDVRVRVLFTVYKTIVNAAAAPKILTRTQSYYTQCQGYSITHYTPYAVVRPSDGP
jgi:hypothetical protein